MKHPSYVCRLKKALYGLKQAPRSCHARIASYLVSIAFCMVDSDNSLYVQKNDHGIVTICICVDDLIVGGDHEVDIEHVKTLLKEEFDMKDLGDSHHILGMCVTRDQKQGLLRRVYA